MIYYIWKKVENIYGIILENIQEVCEMKEKKWKKAAVRLVRKVAAREANVGCSL